MALDPFTVRSQTTLNNSRDTFATVYNFRERSSPKGEAATLECAKTKEEMRAQKKEKKKNRWQAQHDGQRRQNIKNIENDHYLSKRIKTYNAILTTNGLTVTDEPVKRYEAC